MKRLPVWHKNKVVAYALVDDEDFDELDRYRWRKHSKGYVTRSTGSMGKETRLLLHREIVGASRGQQVDHRDRDKMNNQRDNLRVVSNSKNMHNRGLISSNTSGLTGVSWDSKRCLWRAKVYVEGKQHHLGRFESLESAKEAVTTFKGLKGFRR